MFFFLLFKCLLPSPPEEVYVFVLHDAWSLEAEGPEHQWGQRVQSSLDGFRTAMRAGRAAAPDHKDVLAVSL